VPMLIQMHVRVYFFSENILWMNTPLPQFV